MKNLKLSFIFAINIFLFSLAFSDAVLGAGLKLAGSCKNEECPDYGRKVDCQMGMGEFSLVSQNEHMKGKCPLCKGDFVSEAFSFIDCLYTVGEGKEQCAQGESVIYTNQNQYKTLKCSAKDLQAPVLGEAENNKSSNDENKGKLGFFKENYLDCFYTINNVQGFNAITGRLDFLTPGGRRFSSFKAFLEDEDTKDDIESLFFMYKNGLVGEKAGLLSKGFGLITNDRCRSMMEKEVALSLNVIMTEFISQMITITGPGEGNFVNAKAITSGELSKLNQKKLQGVFEIFTVYHDIGAKYFYSKSLKDQGQKKLLTGYFEAPLMKHLNDLNYKINDIYGHDLGTLQKSFGTDYMLDVVRPLRAQILGTLLADKNLSPYLASYFLGEFLKPIMDRIVNVTKVKDLLSSVFSEDEIEKDSLSQTIELLSLLDRPEEFSRILNSKKSDTVDPRIKEIFKIIDSNLLNYKALLKFINLDHKMSYGLEIFKENGEIRDAENDVKAYSLKFFELVQKAKKMRIHKIKTATFNGQEVKDIEFALSKDKLNKIIEISKELNNGLSKGIDASKGDSVESKWKHLISVENQKNSLSDVIRKEESLLEKKQKEIFSLSKNISMLRQDLDSYYLNFSSLVDRVGKSKEESKIVYKDTLSISPDSGNNISFEVQKGDIVRFNIANNWTPSCALQKDGINPEKIMHARVGPLGYDFNVSSGILELKGVNDTLSNDHYHEKGKSYEKCLETYAIASHTSVVTVGTPLSVVWGSGAKGEFSTELGVKTSYAECSSTLTGDRQTQGHTSTNSKEEKNSKESVFSLGLRSANAPYPNWPAGSLLAVELPLNSSNFSKIKSITIVDRNQIYFANENSTLYLVPNDCADQQGLSSGSLAVTINQERKMSGLAKELADNLSKSFNVMTTKSEELAKEGLISHIDLAQLRSLVQKEFLSSGSYSFGEMQIYQDLFNYWMETELSLVEKKSRLSQLNHEKNMLVLNLENLFKERDRRKVEQVFSYNSILFGEDVASYYKLEHEFEKTLEFLGDVTFPALFYFYSDFFDKHLKKSQFYHQLTIGKDEKSLSEALNSFLTDLFVQIEKKDLGSNGLTKSRVVVSIPKIDIKSSDENLVDEYFNHEAESGYFTLDAPKSDMFWQKFLAKEEQKITFKLSDIYSGSVCDSLDKTCSFPVLKSLRVFLVFDTDKYNNFKLRSLPVNVFEIAPYVLKDRISYYRILSNELTSFNAQVLSGTGSEMNQILKEHAIDENANNGQGLSPFSTITFNLGSLVGGGRFGKAILNEIKEVRIIMEIESKTEKKELLVF